MAQPQDSSEGWVVGKGDPIPEGVEPDDSESDDGVGSSDEDDD